MSQIRKYLMAAALLLLALSAYVHFVSANATDKNWLLFAAQELLSGKRLYVDIFEINPPLILWIYAIPTWIAGQFHLFNSYKMLALLACAVIAGVTGLSTYFISFHDGFTGNKNRQGCFALLLAYVFIFFTAPMYFFDKEHILLVCTFPYAIRFAPGLARKEFSLRLRILTGLLAAVGFCIKPHAVIVFAALQALYLVRERSAAILVSVENRIIYLFAALYLAFIVCCMPDYLHTIIPMALATYSAYSRKLTGIYSLVPVVVMLGMTFADFRRGHDTPFRKGVYYFLGITAAYLAYALLNNGWAYTYNPVISMTRFLAGWVGMEFAWLKADAEAKGLPPKRFRFGMYDCAIVLLLNMLFYLSCFAVYFMPFNCEESLSCKSTAIFFREAGQYHVRSFGAMSLEFYKWSELSRETGEQWDTRFNHLWMLPKFLLSGEDFARKNAWIKAYVGNAYAEDLNRWKLEIVFVDSSPEFFKGHAHFDLPAYYGPVPAFAQAWTHYRRTGVIDACVNAPSGKPQEDGIRSDCRFDVYSRISAP